MVDISQNFQRHTDVEILTSFGRHVFNVLLLWNSDEFLTSCFQRPTDIEILTSFRRHVFNVQLTLIFGCSTSSTKFNVFSTLVQRHMPAGDILWFYHVFAYDVNCALLLDLQQLWHSCFLYVWTVPYYDIYAGMLKLNSFIISRYFIDTLWRACVQC